ncbi:MAG: NUDIX hydrolase [Herpetosiphon sp.]
MNEDNNETEGKQDVSWVAWVKRLQSIAQDGLTYSHDEYDRERYHQLQAITAEIAAHYSAAPLDTMYHELVGQTGPATPKVDVRGAVFRQEHILLVKEHDDGYWSLPGGWADVGEPPSDGVMREILEETGYRVGVKKLAAVYDRDRHAHTPNLYSIYKLFFLCEIVGNEQHHTIDTAAVRFFPVDNLPPLSIARVTAAQIARMVEHYRRPELPTDYD